MSHCPLNHNERSYMPKTRTFPINDPKHAHDTTWDLTYTAEYIDHSFDYDGPMGPATHKQGGYEVEHWELTISKFTLGWRSITIDCLEVPEPLFDVLNTLVEKHLEGNPPNA
jgi:hypothetical protein